MADQQNDGRNEPERTSQDEEQIRSIGSEDREDEFDDADDLDEEAEEDVDGTAS